MFEFDIRNSSGKLQLWTVDLKNGLGNILIGKAPRKADIIIAVTDEDFVELASGKISGIHQFK